MPGLGVGIIILNKGNQVLLIKRNSDAIKADSKMHLESLWTLPAGKVLIGETLLDAAIRKAKDEVNLTVSNLHLISIADDINTYAHFVTVGFISKVYTGSIKIDGIEHVDYMWCSINELPDNLCMPSRKIINNYLNNNIYNN